MSLWTIGLGLSAGYLISKNMSMHTKLQDTITQFQEQAEEASPGPATSEIRGVQATVPPGDIYQDLNLQDLSGKEAQWHVDNVAAHKKEVMRYESSAPPPIEGVYLTFDNFGV